MKLHDLRHLIVIAVLTLSACGAFKSQTNEDPAEQPKTEKPQLIGRIASIPADKRFVLIQSYETWNVEVGTILTTRGPDERTANLLVTGESLGQFAAADLQSGLVEVGDAVYSSHIPKPVEAAGEPADTLQVDDNQQNPGSENVQKNN